MRDNTVVLGAGLLAELTVLLLIASCSTSARDDGTTSAASAPTSALVAKLYAMSAESIRRGVYHATITVRKKGPGFSPGLSDGTYDQWVDVARDTAKTTGPEEALLVVGKTQWSKDSHQRAVGCHGASPAASLVLGCPGPLESSTASASPDRHQGKSAISIRTVGAFLASDWTTKFRRTLWVDPHTALPIAADTSGTYDEGQPKSFAVHTTWTHEFIERTSLPRDFFSPESVGYRAGQRLRVLPANLPVYWLGDQFDPGAGLPTLSSLSVEVGDGSLYDALIDYSGESNTAGNGGESGVMIQLYAHRAVTYRDLHGLPPCQSTSAAHINGAAVAWFCNAKDLLAVLRFPTVTVIVFPYGEPFSTTGALRRVLNGLRKWIG